jgi:hypothetical protein
MTFAAWYGIVVGALMLAQWAFFLFTSSVPELKTEPTRIGFHLAGEFVTAIGLVVAGIAILGQRAWGSPLFLAAVGMVVYSEIVSPGYFAQKGRWVFVGMFAVLLALAVLAIVFVARDWLAC